MLEVYVREFVRKFVALFSWANEVVVRFELASKVVESIMHCASCNNCLTLYNLRFGILVKS